jgi:hypothetical protein
MKAILILATMAAVSAARASEFRHVGDYLLDARYKLTGERVTAVPMKALALHVFTDGVRIRISAEGDDAAHTTYEIYRSDGIGRQRGGAGALEVIPGLQATCTIGGTLRHLRLTREELTITTFPGVSDQTIVSHAVAAEPAAPPVSARQDTPNPKSHP